MLQRIAKPVAALSLACLGMGLLFCVFGEPANAMKSLAVGLALGLPVVGRL
jgi:hypothetical protein